MFVPIDNDIEANASSKHHDGPSQYTVHDKTGVGTDGIEMLRTVELNADPYGNVD